DRQAEGVERVPVPRPDLQHAPHAPPAEEVEEPVKLARALSEALAAEGRVGHQALRAWTTWVRPFEPSLTRESLVFCIHQSSTTQPHSSRSSRSWRRV